MPADASEHGPAERIHDAVTQHASEFPDKQELGQEYDSPDIVDTILSKSNLRPIGQAARRWAVRVIFYEGGLLLTKPKNKK